jgi:hypothetical protein
MVLALWSAITAVINLSGKVRGTVEHKNKIVPEVRQGSKLSLLREGQIWKDKADYGPFDTNKHAVLRVLEIKDGFVKFQWVDGGFIDSIRADRFASCYEPIPLTNK